MLPKFEYGWYLTAFELVNFAFFAWAERALRKEKVGLVVFLPRLMLRPSGT